MRTLFFSKSFRRQCAIGAATGVMAWAGMTSARALDSVATNDPAADPDPTYLRDVQPIFMGNCSRCHNQESRFVYNWLDYRTAYKDRWEIRRRVWDSWKGS